MDTQAIQASFDAHLKAVDAAIEKYHGQLSENGKVANEARDEVKRVTEQFKQLDDSIRELSQKMQAASLQGGPTSAKTAGEEFVQSPQFKAFAEAKDNRGSSVRVELKNTITTGAGTTFPTQMPGIIPGSFVPLTVRQALRTIPISTPSITSRRELAWTNSAAETAEGSLKPDSSLTFEEYDVTIRTVAHHLKLSNQLIADAPATTAYVNVRLRDGLAQRIDNQLINGNGTAPNISGLTDSGNFTAYTSTSVDNLIDAVNRIKWLMWSAGNAPDTVFVNPADWGEMERTREGAGTGMYLYGAPGTAGNANPFGLVIIPTPYLQAGKIIVARLSDSALVYQRAGAVIEMGYENDDFTKNLVTVRAEERLALACDRPAGIYYGDFNA